MGKERKDTIFVDGEKLLEAQGRLAEILNDTPHIVNLQGTEYAVTRLKNGTQYLICEEAVKICRNENMSFGDIMKQFAVNLPSIFHVITLALLNDKGRIYKDGKKHLGFSDEYNATYDTLMWEVTDNSLVSVLTEVLSMIDIDFFLKSSEAVKMMRAMLTRGIQQQKS